MISILCKLCGEPGQYDEYKGDVVYRCPECEEILYRVNDE